MTARFGDSSTAIDEVGAVTRAASAFMAGWIAVANHIVPNFTIQYEHQQARVSLHGTSKHSGNGYDRGQIAALLWTSNVILPLVPMLATSGTTHVAWLLIGVPCAALSMVACIGFRDGLKVTEVVDHTTPAEPEATGRLRESYVRGEIDDDEFEQRLEEALES